jgi:CBS domain-containing protein
MVVGSRRRTVPLENASPEWTLEDAALAMSRKGVRHLVVLEGTEVLAVISVRDIMRVWAVNRTGASA